VPRNGISEEVSNENHGPANGRPSDPALLFRVVNILSLNDAPLHIRQVWEGQVQLPAHRFG